MTTPEIEYAVIKNINVRQHYVIRNLSWGIHNLHECDILKLTKSGYATEYEIKISRSDLLRDKDKKHGHSSPYIKELYFVVPYHLIDFAHKNIPDRAGLIAVYDMPRSLSNSKSFNETNYQLRHLRSAKVNTKAIKWSDKDIFDLLRLSNMRLVRYTRDIARIKWEERNG